MHKTLPASLVAAVLAAAAPAVAQDFVIPEVGPGRCVASCGGGSSSSSSGGGSSLNLPSGFSANSSLGREFGSGEGVEGFADRSSASGDGEAEAELRKLLESVGDGSAVAPALALAAVEVDPANVPTADLAELARQARSRRIQERARLMQQRDRYILESARHEQTAIYWEMAKLSAETLKLGADLFAIMTLPYNPMVATKVGAEVVVALNARRGFQIAQKVGEVGDALYTGYQTYQAKKGEGQTYAVFAALGAGGLKLGVDVGAGKLTDAVGKWALKATNASKKMGVADAIVQNISVGLIYMGVNAGGTSAKMGTGAALAPNGST